jgi:hypothetical protein
VAVTGERVAKSLPLSELCAHRIVEITYVLVDRARRGDDRQPQVLEEHRGLVFERVQLSRISMFRLCACCFFGASKLTSSTPSLKFASALLASTPSGKGMAR